MKKLVTSVAIAATALACGGSTRDDSTPSGGGSGGVATGGSGGGGNASGTSGGGGTGNAGGVSGGGGSGNAGGVSGGGGTGAVAGAAGAGGSVGEPCLGLDYCSCKTANADCQVFSEACFCPCGVEPCEPACACACGGGKYLGCGPQSILQPGAAEGIWLIGWSGGMNHYSWVRFNADSSADILDGQDLPINAPLWPCSGKGSWQMAAKPNTLFLVLPAACNKGMPLTFESLGPPADPYVTGSTLSAVITSDPTGGQLEGYKFAPSQCDATMTSCKSPLQG